MLLLHGIESVSLHGKLSQKQRAEILDDFRKGGPDHPRVMLMSSVGAVGLNMSFASVLIIAVSISYLIHHLSPHLTLSRMFSGRSSRTSSWWGGCGGIRRRRPSRCTG